MELCSKVISHWSAHLEVASLLSHLHPELSKRLHFLETKFLPSNIGVNFTRLLDADRFHLRLLAYWQLYALFWLAKKTWELGRVHGRPSLLDDLDVRMS